MEWEKQFDKVYVGSSRSRIKDFICPLLEEARKEGYEKGFMEGGQKEAAAWQRLSGVQEAIQKERERWIEEIEKKNTETTHFRSEDFMDGFYDGIKFCLSLLRTKEHGNT